MTAKGQKAEQLRINERKFVEESFLAQLDGLDWGILDLDGSAETPKDSDRTNFAQMIMKPVLRESFRNLNLWLKDDQVDEVLHRIRTFPSKNRFMRLADVFRLHLDVCFRMKCRQALRTGQSKPQLYR